MGDTMLYVGNSKAPYRCSCGANVFKKQDEARYVCNGCKSILVAIPDAVDLVDETEPDPPPAASHHAPPEDRHVPELADVFAALTPRLRLVLSSWLARNVPAPAVAKGEARCECGSLLNTRGECRTTCRLQPAPVAAREVHPWPRRGDGPLPTTHDFGPPTSATECAEPVADEVEAVARAIKACGLCDSAGCAAQAEPCGGCAKLAIAAIRALDEIRRGTR